MKLVPSFFAFFFTFP
ncbi:pheA operon leader peptide PheL [Klebsiella pneumoniae]